MKSKKIISAIALSLMLLLSTPVHASGQTLSSTNYVVQPGDSLYKIAAKFNTTVSSIASLNGITNYNTIYTGQNLLISKSQQTTEPAHYVVQSGDSLYKIAVKFNTTVNVIASLNKIASNSMIYPGQNLLIQANEVKSVQTVNYVVQPGDTLWGLSKKYNTSVDAIKKSNMLEVDYVMPRQTLTIPVNSTEVVKPVGITMLKARVNSYYGDIYTWENAMRIWSTGTKGILKDLATGKTFNVKYYGGSNHSDIVPLTLSDTNIMKSVFGSWSWLNKRPMVLYFTKGGVNYQMAASLIGMPHSTTDITNNGLSGHLCLYFYNSGGHANPNIDPVAQSNVLKANGQ